MKASIVDLRYRMKEVLEALGRQEEVAVMYHRKQIATLVPIKASKRKKVEAHAYFGLASDETEQVDKLVDKLRGGRYHDV